MRSSLITLAFYLPAIALLIVFVGKIEPRDDPRLYYELSGQVLGRGGDEQYLQQKRGLPAPESRESHLLKGTLPYRDVMVEYPPMALGLFVLPRLLTDSMPAYTRLFQSMMASVFLLATVALARLLHRVQPGSRHAARQAALAATLVLLCSGSYLLRRYDLVMSVTVAGALLSMLWASPLMAGLLLGLAASLKLWPVLLLPLFCWHDLRPRAVGRLLVGFAFLPALSHLVMLPVVGTSAFNYFGFQAGRGFQVESLWSSILLPAARLLHLAFDTPFDHGSVNLTVPGVTPLVLLLTYPLAAGALAMAYIGSFLGLRRSAGGDPTHRFLAANLLVISVLIVTAKVLSPQYLLWMFPLAFCLRDRWIAVTYLLALAFTHLYFPEHYDWLTDTTRLGIVVLFLRNVILIVLCALALRATAFAKAPAVTSAVPAMA